MSTPTLASRIVAAINEERRGKGFFPLFQLDCVPIVERELAQELAETAKVQKALAACASVLDEAQRN